MMFLWDLSVRLLCLDLDVMRRCALYAGKTPEINLFFPDITADSQPMQFL